MRKRHTRTGLARPLVFLIACSVALGAGGFSVAMPPSQSANDFVEGDEVLETMNAGGYTYIRVRTEDKEIWAAGPQGTVAVGDRVNLPAGALMPSFHSKALDRTFEEIYFVGAIEIVGGSKSPHGGGSPPAGHATGGRGAAMTPGSLQKAEGGSTIAELYARRGELAGKQVLVRGQVVKFTANIMGRNWMHIQDGTGQPGSNDLTVTTADSASVGDVVLVKGTAAVDRDFGAGYRYELIVEQAGVTVE